MTLFCYSLTALVTAGTLSFEEFMARKNERERLARLAILEKQVRKHGESVIRNAIHLGPAWTRYRLEGAEEETTGNVDEPPVDTGTYYW